jgi:hypothetical protein
MRSFAPAVLVLAACSSGSDKVDRERAADRALPTPAEQAAAPRSSAERMFVPTPAPAPAPAQPASGGMGTPEPTPAPAEPAGRAPYATLTPRWSEIRTFDGCFYFSGPQGRDDQLTGPTRVERDGQHVILHIGNAVFTGTYVAGELDVKRRSVHDFGGPWNVDETIHGRYLDGVMVGKYHYNECEQSTPCAGGCQIDAKITFMR